jgi:hypothetical protein
MSKQQEYFEAVEKCFTEEGLEKPVRPEGHTWAGYPPQDPAIQPVEALSPDPEYEWVRIRKLPPDRATQAGDWYREDSEGEYGWVRIKKPPTGREAQRGHWYKEEWHEEVDRWNSTQASVEAGHFHNGWSYLQRNSYDKTGRRSAEYRDSYDKIDRRLSPPVGHEEEEGHWLNGRWYPRSIATEGYDDSDGGGHWEIGGWYRTRLGIKLPQVQHAKHEVFVMKSPSEVTRPFSDLERKLIRDTILFIEQNIDREGILDLSKCSVHGSIVLPHKVCREVIRAAKVAGYYVAETEPLFHTEIKLPLL